MKRNLKVLFAFFAVLALAFGLAACGSSDQKKLDAAHKELEIHFTAPDNKDSVTKDLTLVPSVGEVQVTWVSEKTDIISNAGKVTAPAADTLVKITATLKIGELSKDKDFTVNVKKGADYEAILNSVELDLEKDGQVYVTDKDIVLPTTHQGHTLVWNSADAETITVTGKVTRPSFGEEDKVVTLTVSLGGVERQILVKVLAIAEQDPAEILAEAKDMLLIPGTTDGVANNLDLPLTVGQKGVTVTWKSSNVDVITDDGKVTLGDEQVTVIMTATLHLEGYTGEPVTKEFSLLVHIRPEGKKIDNLAEITNLTENPKGTYVLVEGVTVVGITKDGFMIYDGSLLVFVYDGTLAKKVEVGEVYDIEGSTNIYYGAVQIQKGNAAAEVVVLTPSEKPASVLTPTVVDNIKTYLNDKPEAYGDDVPFVFEYIQVTAFVKVFSLTDNYGVALVDNLEGDFTTGTKQPTEPINKNGLVVYYQSNKDAVAPYNGLKITLNVFLYGLRTDRRIFSSIFTGTINDVEFDGTDAEIVDVVESSVKQNIKDSYFEAETISLPTEFLGATIAWTSDKPLLINAETGAVVMPETGQEEVILTAVITKGDESKTVTIKVKVGELQTLTIAEAIAMPKGSEIKVEGILTSMGANNTYFLQDATHGIAVYIAGTDANITSEMANSLGKKVVFLGEKDIYNGLQQVRNISSFTALDEVELPEFVSLDTGLLDSDTLLPHQGKLVSIKKGSISNRSTGDNYIQFTITRQDNASIVFRYDTRTVLPEEVKTKLTELKNGDVFDLEGLIVNWYNGPQLSPSAYFKVTEPVLTDDEIVNEVENSLNGLISSIYYKNQTVELPATLNEAAIAWTSSNDDHFNATTGAVVIPAADFVEVTLTAVVTKGAANKTVTITTKVGVPGAFVVSITNAKELVAGTETIIEGVLLGLGANNTYAIEDASGAIALFVGAATEDVKTALEGAYGKNVVIVGIRAEYKGLEQLEVVDAIVGEAGTVPPALSLDMGELDAETLKPHQSKLVSITKVTISGYSKDGNGNVSFVATREDSKSINFRWDSRVALDAELKTLLEGLQNGQIVDITNSILGWFDNPQLTVSGSFGIALIELTDAEKVAHAKAELIERFADKSFNMGTAANLPETSDLGATITWVLDPVDAVTAEDNWKDVEANLAVTLTATIKSGEVEETQVLNVTIKFVDPSVPEPVTVTTVVAASGGNFAEDQNIASDVGLNSDIFDVRAIKNEPGQNIGDYSDGFRIYSVRATGNGNTLSISVDETTHKILSVEFVISRGEGTAKLILGSAESTLTPAQLTGTLKYEDLDISSFSLQNIHEGGTSNLQIRIASITITYVEV